MRAKLPKISKEDMKELEQIPLNPDNESIQVEAEVSKPIYYFATFMNGSQSRLLFFNSFMDRHPFEVIIEVYKKKGTLSLISWQEIDEETYNKYKNAKCSTQIEQ